MNRARPMAARLKKKKTRVKHEPCSAHGRAVNKKVAHFGVFCDLLPESDARQHGIYLFYIITKNFFLFQNIST